MLILIIKNIISKKNMFIFLIYIILLFIINYSILPNEYTNTEIYFFEKELVINMNSVYNQVYNLISTVIVIYLVTSFKEEEYYNIVSYRSREYMIINVILTFIILLTVNFVVQLVIINLSLVNLNFQKSSLYLLMFTIIKLYVKSIYLLMIVYLIKLLNKTPYYLVIASLYLIINLFQLDIFQEVLSCLIPFNDQYKLPYLYEIHYYCLVFVSILFLNILIFKYKDLT